MSERELAQLQADLIAEKWDEDLRGFAPWQHLPSSLLRDQCMGVAQEDDDVS